MLERDDDLFSELVQQYHWDLDRTPVDRATRESESPAERVQRSFARRVVTGLTGYYQVASGVRVGLTPEEVRQGFEMHRRGTQERLIRAGQAVPALTLQHVMQEVAGHIAHFEELIQYYETTMFGGEVTNYRDMLRVVSEAIASADGNVRNH
jgi:hypothetical protein